MGEGFSIMARSISQQASPASIKGNLVPGLSVYAGRRCRWALRWAASTDKHGRRVASEHQRSTRQSNHGLLQPMDLKRGR